MLTASKTPEAMSRLMARTFGCEKTPDEWRRIFLSMITDYRVRHPNITANKDNSEVWKLIYMELFQGKI